MPAALPLAVDLLRARGVTAATLAALRLCLLPCAGGPAGWLEACGGVGGGGEAGAYRAALNAAAELLAAHVRRNRAAAMKVWGPDWGDWDAMLSHERQAASDSSAAGGGAAGEAPAAAEAACLVVRRQGRGGDFALPSLTLLGDLALSCVYAGAPLPRCLMVAPGVLAGIPARVSGLALLWWLCAAGIGGCSTCALSRSLVRAWPMCLSGPRPRAPRTRLR